MLPNATQVQTTTASLASGFAVYAADHGWLGLDVGAWGALAAAAIAVWPFVVTRLQSLKNTVGNSGAVVITSAESAKALPNNDNVIAANPQLTAAIGAVK